MVAVNKKCYTCKFLKTDFACAVDYCERGNDDIVFDESDEKNQCELFKPIKDNIKKARLSVTFIEDTENRRWTYGGVSKIETGINSIFVYCSDEIGNHVFCVLNSEFTRVEVKKENNEFFDDWLCDYTYADYKSDNNNIKRYNEFMSFLSTERDK